MSSVQKHLAEILKDDACYEIVQVFEDGGVPEKLTAYIQHLMDKNFEGLVNLLYRIDVNENKIKAALKEYGAEKGAEMIAQLIIERLKQIIKSRQGNKRKGNADIADEEKW